MKKINIQNYNCEIIEENKIVFKDSFGKIQVTLISENRLEAMNFHTYEIERINNIANITDGYNTYNSNFNLSNLEEEIKDWA